MTAAVVAALLKPLRTPEAVRRTRDGPAAIAPSQGRLCSTWPNTAGVIARDASAVATSIAPVLIPSDDRF